MPRNTGTGVYTPPPNITAVPLQTIESDDWNRLIQDVAATLNAPWPVNLGGTGSSTLAGLLAAIGGVAKTGDTMGGALTMAGDATAALHPVTKQQFDVGLATKANASHTQTAATITDFNSAVTTAIGTASIDALSDVSISGAAAGQTLVHNGTQFVNAAPYVDYDKGTYVISTKYTQAHGLGRLPSNFIAFLKCVSTDNEYAVGDMIPIASFSGLGGSAYVPTWMNTTEVGMSPRLGLSMTAVAKGNLVDGTTFIPARWNVVFRVFS